MTPEEASQPQLAAAVVDRCGGRVQSVPWEQVALAIWRAFPERASLRTGFLPDTYSIQTWVWDAKTKLGFLVGGTREGGWRLTDEGARWLDENPSIKSHVRDLLLDSSDYEAVAESELILVCLSLATSPRSAVTIEAFRRFPEMFGLSPTRVWPDSAVVDSALVEARHKGWISQTSDGFALTPAGINRSAEIEELIGHRRKAAISSRRSVAGYYVSRVEATKAHRTYLETGDRDTGTAEELYVLMRCPPNAGSALAEASLAELLDNIARADRPDLFEFVSRWASRAIPDLRTAEGGRRK